MKAQLFVIPGRVTRKAREYSQEIRRLRAEGCTFEAIRGALASAGIHVSKTTVIREATRPHDKDVQQIAAPAASQLSGAPVRPQTAEDPNVPRSALVAQNASCRTAREIAEEFVLTHPTNPLVKSKERK